jgi:hypothetical protein
MPEQQLTAAAHHLKSSEVNKIILATNWIQEAGLYFLL